MSAVRAFASLPARLASLEERIRPFPRLAARGGQPIGTASAVPFKVKARNGSATFCTARSYGQTKEDAMSRTASADSLSGKLISS